MVTERDKAIGYAQRALRVDIYEGFRSVTQTFWNDDQGLKPSDIYAIVSIQWGDDMAVKYIDWFNSNYGEGAWE